MTPAKTWNIRDKAKANSIELELMKRRSEGEETF